MYEEEYEYVAGTVRYRWSRSSISQTQWQLWWADAGPEWPSPHGCLSGYYAAVSQHEDGTATNWFAAGFGCSLCRDSSKCRHREAGKQRGNGYCPADSGNDAAGKAAHAVPRSSIQ